MFYAKKEEVKAVNFKGVTKDLESQKNTDVMLDQNHTHFILVDDGSEGIEF